MQEFKPEINGVKTLKDLGMLYATENSKHKVRMAYFECPDCGIAFKSVYYRPASRCSHCSNSHIKVKTNSKFKITDGTIFSRLTVLREVEPLKSAQNASRKRYEVACECGNIFVTTGTALRIGKATECVSCACKKRPQSTPIYTQEERMFKKVVQASAKARGIECTITVEDYINTATKNCHYCGASPVPIDYLTRKEEIPIPVNGIDRQDSSLGYILNNIVPCCRTCNTMKNDLTVENFLQHTQRIVSYSIL